MAPRTERFSNHRLNNFNKLHPLFIQNSRFNTGAVMKRSQKHIIHKAMLWLKILDEVRVKSLSEIAQKEGMTLARVTQIMNLLKLPAEWQGFLAELDDPKEIRKYSERRLRNWHPSKFAHLPPSFE
jgi:hypothetical protein